MEQLKQHEQFMWQALKQAQKAFDMQEVPVGCVIVCDGKIVARAYNMVERKDTQCAHAELLALQKAGKKLGDWRLLNCWLYVTLEPCSMCMHAIKMHRLAGIVFGADSPLFGYQLDKKGFDSVYKDDTLRVISGVLKKESGNMLKKFFKNRRCSNALSKKIGRN